jgi:hypothetical protein
VIIVDVRFLLACESVSDTVGPQFTVVIHAFLILSTAAFSELRMLYAAEQSLFMWRRR